VDRVIGLTMDRVVGLTMDRKIPDYWGNEDKASRYP